jgi:sporulation protein YlmC with PRC-barrel domain
MRLDLDAKVKTRDGDEVGDLQWAIVDAATNTVSHLVVSTRDLVERMVEVPLEIVEGTSADGDVLHLRLSRAEFERMPEHLPAQYAGPPPGWHPLDTWRLPAVAFRWPIVEGNAAVTEPGPNVVGPEIGIGKGATVLDVHNQEVGVVEDVQFDDQSGRLDHLVLRIGGRLRTLFGGGDTVVVSADRVESIVEGAVYLNAAGEELRKEGR